MDGTVIEEPGEVDPMWLTAVLTASGALGSGAVVGVDVEAVTGTWSRTARLRVRYDAAAIGLCPATLVLKICGGDHAVFGRSEVDYYTRDYRGAVGVPVARCHHAAYRDRPRGYHLLLEDLSPTHSDAWDLPPSLALGEAMADAVARLHAARWGPARLAAIGASVPGEPELARYLAHVAGGLEPLLALVGDSLAPAWRQALVDTFAYHQRVMVRRAGDGAGITLVHGDVNPGNVMVPRPGHDGPVLLIDRQPFDWSLPVWIGAWDLAYPMVLYWEPDQRRQWQEPVLRRYRASLAAAGIELSWDELWRDYRLAVVQCLANAVEWLVVPADRSDKRWLWEMQLSRAMDAYLELGCDQLWVG